MLGIINAYTYFKNLICWLNSDYRFEISGPDLAKNIWISLSIRQKSFIFAVAQCYKLVNKNILVHCAHMKWIPFRIGAMTKIDIIEWLWIDTI